MYGADYGHKVIFRAKMTRLVMIYQHRDAYCLRIVMLTAIVNSKVSLFCKMYANLYSGGAIVRFI